MGIATSLRLEMQKRGDAQDGIPGVDDAEEVSVAKKLVK